MGFEQETRNQVQKFVNETRDLLINEFTRQLQHKYGLDPLNGEISDLTNLTSLNNSELETARLLRETLDHYLAGGYRSSNIERKEGLQRIVREQAFTILNRLCALRMAEARGYIIESISKGYKSKGFQLYTHISGNSLGETGDAYRSYIYSVFDEVSLSLPVLFNRFSLQGRLFPRETVLLKLLELINDPQIIPLWSEDETIGWIYQYFNEKSEREAMRKAARSPRNSRELAVRNQFFTPRYIVEFLADNTLGRIWYEMTKGNTALVDRCKYLHRFPSEVFSSKDIENVKYGSFNLDTSIIPQRQLKDPRELRVLDPACGSMHFGLYAFDLLEQIYLEAWDLEDELGKNSFMRSKDLPPLRDVYSNKEEFIIDVPRLIIEFNLHGIDIDSRAVQIAGLSLWLRSQKYWNNKGIESKRRPRIQKSNVVCAEPMPGEKVLLQEFVSNIKPLILSPLLENIFDKMKIAGETGPLLKIEKEIENSIKKAKNEFKELENHGSQINFFNNENNSHKTELDFTDINDKGELWNNLENKIIKSLKEYSEKSEVGELNKRRLFTEDTARGFAFIDILLKKYDVVLMNPPFGASSQNSKKYIEKNYPNTKGDLLATFVERALSMINRRGKVGVISSRTPFFLGSFDSFRNEILTKKGHVNLMADLGEGVLDATVETAAYIMTSEKPYFSYSTFYRLLIERKKENELYKLINSPLKEDNRVFRINPATFNRLSGSPFAYWVSSDSIKKLEKFPEIEGNKASVSVGLQTGQDFRFLRLFWEVDPSKLTLSPPLENKKVSSSRDRCIKELSIEKKWVPFSKTEIASPWFSPITLVVNWEENGKELKNFKNDKGKLKSRPQNESQYFIPGFSYMLRSTRLVPYIVPAGVMPTAGRSQIFPREGEKYSVLAICASNIGSAVARFSGEMFARPKFQASMVQNLPASQLPYETLKLVKDHVDKEFNERRKVFQYFEPYQEFSIPLFLLEETVGTASWNVYTLFNDDIENRIATSYGLGKEDLSELERDIHEAIQIRESKKTEEESNDLSESNEKDQEFEVGFINQTTEEKIIGFLSYCIGCSYGRWDIRMSSNHELIPELPEPFDPLPVCAPGMLVNNEGLPAQHNNIASEEWLEARKDAITLPNPTSITKETILDSDYPINIVWDGILVDDENHKNDIVIKVRESIEYIFDKDGEKIEEFICKQLGINSLREYFSKPSKFFTNHLNQYSKNRRQAPIYWPISTESGSYTLWLYYPRMSDQTLYSCVLDYIDPKIKNLEEDVKILRNKEKRDAIEERELEKKQKLSQELSDLRKELLQITRFWKPNTDDGVLITAAPLWKLFKNSVWKNKLKKTWEDLSEGKYDWSKTAYNIWPERVRKKSLIDESISISHNLHSLD
ncbi:BREX-1 system adenine-specific DNA-methyltransferase PglX [Thalassobacillus devorans]|uniref:BREX-1 system adenine-specific DNA-methyltransferase PglX n=1 Tax=Thalassobacillus devorans TaxID=279813 RepID=UPI00048ABEB4|nr:BREX-1 system adenine-specific DNA-methyltransferase PglX [Thalassobacillus devorans]